MGGSFASLPVDDFTFVIPGLYTITQADIDSGFILNSAGATGFSSTGRVSCSASYPIYLTTPAPKGSTMQTLPQGATLADIVVEGENIQWYSTSTKKIKEAANTPLPLTTVLVNNTTYYATQTINGIQSAGKLPVTVSLSSLSANNYTFTAFKYYPNPVKNSLTIGNASVINEVIIYDFLGKALLTKKINKTTSEIDMATLVKGVYFMKVKSGNQEKTLKIMKD